MQNSWAKAVTVREYLPSKHRALDSISSTAKREKDREKEEMCDSW
jgi:hypothetical protein